MERAAVVARTLLQPCAILANGPPCTRAGVCSSVWITFGRMASFNSAAIAPTACRSFAVTGFPSRSYATMILPRRSLRSSRSVARQRIAMISEATVITKWSSLTKPSVLLPSPTTTFRRTRSFISRHRFQTIWRVSIRSALPCWIWLSRSAASRLFAEVMAWKSPVKCRFRSSIGTTCA